MVKHLLKMSVLTVFLCGSQVFAEEENKEMKLNGLYMGVGLHINHEHAKWQGKDFVFHGEHAEDAELGLAALGGRFNLASTNLSAGGHVILGYGNVFGNGFYTAGEVQADITCNPGKVEALGQSIDTKALKELSGLFLVRLGKKLGDYPGVVYLSLGGQLAKSAKADSKVLFRPTFGVGYQHGISKHCSIRGDLLYTNFNNATKGDVPIQTPAIDFNYSGRVNQWSARVSVCYTF
jgi:hypothetical protein